jgi:hypothetical protein
LQQITFIFEDVGKVDGILDENLNPETVKYVLKALPLDSKVDIWGDEIYFATPIKAKLENARVEVSTGDIAYWPPGQAICLFFGPTPLSRNNEPKAASPVNVVGRLLDLRTVKMVKTGYKVKIVRKS